MDIQSEINQLKAQLDDLYSPVGLMTTEEVGKVIRKSPGTIRTTLASTLRRRQGWARRLLQGKVRMGKTVFFRTRAVAECILLGDSDGQE